MLSTEVLKVIFRLVNSLEESSVVVQVMTLHLSLLAKLMDIAGPIWEQIESYGKEAFVRAIHRRKPTSHFAH